MTLHVTDIPLAYISIVNLIPGNLNIKIHVLGISEVIVLLIHSGRNNMKKVQCPK